MSEHASSLSLRHPLRLLASPMVWSLHFLAVYVLTALAAHPGIAFEEEAARVALIAITVVASLLIIALLTHSAFTLSRALKTSPISSEVEPIEPVPVDIRNRQVAVSWAVIDCISLLGLAMVSIPIAVLPL